MASGQQENSNDGLLLMGMLLAALVAIWYFFGQYLATGYIFTKRAEYYALKLILVDKIFAGAWASHVGAIEPLLFGHFKTKPSLKELGAIGSGVGFFSRWIYAAGLAYVTYRVLQKNPMQKFKRTHSMASLVASEQKLWPAIAPVQRLNLIKEDIDKGPWMMSRKPLDFTRFYRLLDEGNKLNRERAEKLFAMQLGKLWEGTDKLPPYAQALFTCFAAQACGDLDVAKIGLDKLSIAMADKKEDYGWVAPLLAKYEKQDVVQNVMKKHAYVYTVMASMLKAARGFGVLQSPEFIWLRPKNRQLWYILNGVGRRVSFAEVGGIYAHWIAEEVAEHPIERPYVVKAVDALERALLEVKFD
jgi:intracellular multiplication protein IcmP